MSAYLITSPKMSGSITLMYGKNGILTSIKFDLKQPLTIEQFQYFLRVIHYTEEELQANGMKRLIVSKDATNSKIALFCRYYEQYIKIKYKVTAADSGKIKTAEINDELLKKYFESDNFLFKGKHSIANFVKYNNELRAELANGAPTKSRFPNHYDRQFERGLTGIDLQQYRQHLRAIGLKPVYHKQNTTQIIDWK